MTTTAQRERTETRSKLYTGHSKVVNGRGGAPIPESSTDERKPGLVQMWSKYLTSELAASKPTLSLPDVATMLEQRKTPRFNAMVPRDLSDAEISAIRAWHDAAKQQEAEAIGKELAAAQTNIMAQASVQPR